MTSWRADDAPKIKGLQIERPVPWWDRNEFVVIALFLVSAPFILLEMASLLLGPVALVVGAIGLLVSAPEFKQEWLWVTLGSLCAFISALLVLLFRWLFSNDQK